MKLSQEVFKDRAVCWKWAARESDGTVWLYKHEPTKFRWHWWPIVSHDCMRVPKYRLQKDKEAWKDSLIIRDGYADTVRSKKKRNIVSAVLDMFKQDS